MMTSLECSTGRCPAYRWTYALVYETKPSTFDNTGDSVTDKTIRRYHAYGAKHVEPCDYVLELLTPTNGAQSHKPFSFIELEELEIGRYIYQGTPCKILRSRWKASSHDLPIFSFSFLPVQDISLTTLSLRLATTYAQNEFISSHTHSTT